jgi:hypothetical protein
LRMTSTAQSKRHLRQAQPRTISALKLASVQARSNRIAAVDDQDSHGARPVVLRSLARVRQISGVFPTGYARREAFLSLRAQRSRCCFRGAQRSPRQIDAQRAYCIPRRDKARPNFALTPDSRGQRRGR